MGSFGARMAEVAEIHSESAGKGLELVVWGALELDGRVG